MDGYFSKLFYGSLIYITLLTGCSTTDKPATVATIPKKDTTHVVKTTSLPIQQFIVDEERITVQGNGRIGQYHLRLHPLGNNKRVACRITDTYPESIEAMIVEGDTLSIQLLPSSYYVDGKIIKVNSQKLETTLNWVYK